VQLPSSASITYVGRLTHTLTKIWSRSPLSRIEQRVGEFTGATEAGDSCRPPQLSKQRTGFVIRLTSLCSSWLTLIHVGFH